RYRYWDEKLPIEVHHGSLSKEIRTEMEDRFKNGDLKALICTSSLELGIDVGSADTVIQYNSPRRVSRMIQRSGRAGHRVGETIRARILATAPDEISESLVIARRCAAGELESRSGRFSPLTVAANQLVAMAMTGPVEKDFAYSVFRGSYSFKTFTRETMDKIIEQLVSIRILFDNGDSFRRTRRGMDHFYENISMIPDVRNYKVIDVGTRAAVGTLDESFVSAFEDSRQLFIAKGRTWRVVEIREDEILVQETREMGAVPSWLGSDIPVPYEIAQEVGRLRAVRDYAPYPCTESCVAALETFFSGQDGHVMPTDRVITVEDDGTQVIVNACFGTKTNETLGRITAALMSMRLGESVGMTADPYRIILELPRIPEKNAVMDILKSLKPGSVDYLSRTAMAGSASLKWRFAYTAKKFGIIEKKADHRYINFGKLFEIHKGTPAYADAVDKVLEEDLDIIHAEEVVARICSGDIEIVPDRPSPVGREGITRSKELMQPMRADHAILMALKKRLGNEVLFSVCMNCGTSRRVRVEDAPKKFRCENCGGVMIALLKEDERDSSALILRKNHSSDDIKELKRMNKCANLVKENGSRAAYVMAGRGIG
ncbi:MAG: ATP-dependent helicase, partial [Candidatus Methanomethylophilaceae archaeon]|nr:ATP-dependent helicase [Candidatus Methanomethylophilaceae archaeon]